MSRSYYILITPIILNFDLTLFPKLEKNLILLRNSLDIFIF